MQTEIRTEVLKRSLAGSDAGQLAGINIGNEFFLGTFTILEPTWGVRMESFLKIFHFLDCRKFAGVDNFFVDNFQKSRSPEKIKCWAKPNLEWKHGECSFHNDLPRVLNN